MPRKTMDIRFPVAGVVRRPGFRSEAEQRREAYPTPWAVNTRLADSLSSRLRGGSWTAIAAGSRPSECRYQDRVLTFSTNAITGTRMGKDTDTAHSGDVSDTRRPALFQLSYGGAIGGTVVALIPHKDSFLLGFTADETWVQQGNPLVGLRRRVSDEVGIIGADAWCKDGHDTVYFLSSHGLYSVGVDGSGLKALSEDVIPEELMEPELVNECSLTYNHADRGVYIHLPNTLDVSWFYDVARGQFWPFDTSDTDSHVLVGPFRLGQANSYGRVLNLHGMIAAGSDDVIWRLVTGDTAEEAAANGKMAITLARHSETPAASIAPYVSASGTWSAGRAHMAYPRVRAVWCCLWLSSEGTWAYEGVAMTAVVSGGWR